MRVSIECLKKQSRQKNWSKSQWPIRIEGNTTRSQWEFKERAASSAGKHNWQGVTIGSSFVSDWLQKWPQFSWPITALARQKRFLIGSDTQFKLAQLLVPRVFRLRRCTSLSVFLLKLSFNVTPWMILFSMPSSSTIFHLFSMSTLATLNDIYF